MGTSADSVRLGRLAGEPTADAFEAALFDNMEQQALGPAVVASVAECVVRLTSPDTSLGSPLGA